MNVKELIEHLHELDPEMRVVVRGYDGGYCDLDDPSDVIDVIVDYNEEWYYGPHEPVEPQILKEMEKRGEEIKIESVLVLE